MNITRRANLFARHFWIWFTAIALRTQTRKARIGVFAFGVHPAGFV